MGVVRHVHSDGKQRISGISQMNLSMSLFFCMLLGIHKYIRMIQSVHMVLVRLIWAYQ